MSPTRRSPDIKLHVFWKRSKTGPCAFVNTVPELTLKSKKYQDDVKSAYDGVLAKRAGAATAAAVSEAASSIEKVRAEAKKKSKSEALIKAREAGVAALKRKREAADTKF